MPVQHDKLCLKKQKDLHLCTGLFFVVWGVSEPNPETRTNPLSLQMLGTQSEAIVKHGFNSIDCT
jgi:hypothetical protein